MTRLQNSDPEGMRVIERDTLIEHERWELCDRCKGTGVVDMPWSGSIPTCPDCDGAGAME